MEATTVLARFFPEPPALQLNAWPRDDTATRVTLQGPSTPQGVPCPVCAVFTPRAHSRYTRTLADRSWGMARVRWPLRVRTGVCQRPMPPAERAGEGLVVSFDGKGVPMLHEEAVKLKAKLGAGETRHKTQEAWAGVSETMP
jgi:hypothetical protein